MKRLFGLSGALAIGITLLFSMHAFASPQFATDDDTRVSVSTKETVKGSWYGASQAVTVDGKVQGDVYCAGQTVEITGKVEGDVLCAAQRIVFTDEAHVTGNVRVAGQEVIFDKKTQVAGSATVFAQVVTVQEGATIGRDLTGAMQRLTLDGTVGRDVTAGSSELVVRGTIGGDINAQIEKSDFDNDALIRGGIYYSSVEELTIPDSVAEKGVHWTRMEESESVDTSAMITGAIIFAATVLAIALIFPRTLVSMSAYVKNHAAMMVGIGFLVSLGVIALPLIALIVFLTGFGVYISIILLVAWVLWLLLVLPVGSYYIGRVIPHGGNDHVLMNALVGGVLVAIALQIPVVGPIVVGMLFIIGNGILAMWTYRTYKIPAYQVDDVIEPEKGQRLQKETKKSSHKKSEK